LRQRKSVAPKGKEQTPTSMVGLEITKGPKKGGKGKKKGGSLVRKSFHALEK